jgi:hypothetical protein
MMKGNPGMKKSIRMLMIVIGLIFMAIPRIVFAEDPSGFQMGAKFGFNAIKHDERFKLYELFCIGALPWNKTWPSKWVMNTGFSLNAGILEAADDKGFVGSVGPKITFHKMDSRFIFGICARMALLDDYKYGDENLGGAFAFIEEFSINYPVSWNVELGYQFRHQSNAGIYDSNPGVDQHVFEFIYRFK